VRIVYGLAPGGGWHPITWMVRLLAELLEAELVVVPLTRPSNAWRRGADLGPRRRGRETCLVVAPQPRYLNALLTRDYWIRGYGHVAGWVIDSFWVERIPARRTLRRFDRLFVTDQEVVEDWRQAAGLPVTWLPWGADVLRLGTGGGDRPVDLQRLGRQPEGWEDDDAVRSACAALGLRYEGRPAMHDDASANQAAVMQSLSRAKFVLAFSNAVSPAPYTHPTREYLTGRWTDALAAGAVVAGIAPRCGAATELLWEGATLELTDTDRAHGLERIAEAVRAWSPAVARENHARALERLDWRRRFAELAAALGVGSARLEAELDALRAA
jgi:hypothetical protein